jgi:hypothetical protein
MSIVVLHVVCIEMNLRTSGLTRNKLTVDVSHYIIYVYLLPEYQ